MIFVELTITYFGKIACFFTIYPYAMQLSLFIRFFFTSHSLALKYLAAKLVELNFDAVYMLFKSLRMHQQIRHQYFFSKGTEMVLN